MRYLALVAALGVLPACAHHATVAPVGATSRPYTALPAYLTAPQGPQAAGAGGPAAPQATVGRSLPPEDQLIQLRGVLAAIDTHVVELTPPEKPSPTTVQELALTADRLTQLVKPYPDIASEAGELHDVISGLGEVPPAQLAATRKRMGELTDLIRLQLVAAR